MRKYLFSGKIEYWLVQLVGWALYGGILVLYSFINGQGPSELWVPALLVAIAGFATSHWYRVFILRNNWLGNEVSTIAWKLVIFAMVFGIVFWFNERLLALLFSNTDIFSMGFVDSILVILNWSFLMLFWSLGYFGINFFFYFRKQKLEHLELMARKNEVELMHLRSQMNPHFMFNSLNSIRALVDENPERAREAVTQLASMLRDSLQLGKKSTITLGQEMKIVENYLAIEGIRYEERLQVSVDVDEQLNNFHLPPLMVQTLVENAIKHGIATLTQGGILNVRGIQHKNYIHLTVENSGVFQPKNKKENTGIGLENTHRRLALIYGKSARLRIYNTEKGTVIARLVMPYT